MERPAAKNVAKKKQMLKWKPLEFLFYDLCNDRYTVF